MSLVHDRSLTHTALLVACPELEPIVGPYRRRLDSSAGWGVPAHVTVLYPFVAPHDLEEPLVERLGAAVSSIPTFDCTFTGTRWFGDEVLWLAPEPDEPFRQLTEAVCRAFPDHPPYGGAYADVVPHLTLGESPTGTTAELLEAERAVLAALPVPLRVDRALLMAGTTRADAWQVVRSLPLGAT